MSRREIIDLLKRKKRLSGKDFLELYDAIWDGTAFVKYQNPDHTEREHVKMLQKQYKSLFYCS
ncbi:MAG: hypothetical protein ABSC91_07735 [Candidatus Bathyarchaeia archaeon]|jgi:hypothetical protein